MVKLSVLTSILVMIVVATSCFERRVSPDEILQTTYFKIQIPGDLDISHMLPADSVFSSVEYIPLETNSDVLLGFMAKLKMVVEGDTIYVLDLSSRSVFCFTSKGKHLKTLSKEGRGPGEYLRPRDLVIERGKIFLLSDSPNRIIEYDASLNFLEEITLPFDVTSFAKSSDLFYIHTRVNRGEKYSIHVIDERGTVINKYIPFNELAIANVQQSMWVHNDAAYAEFHNDYNVYELTRDGYRIFATLDFGKDNLPEEAKEWSNYVSDKTAEYVRQNNLRPPQGLDKVFVNDNYLVVQYTGFLISRSLIWNRKSGEILDQAISNTPSYPAIQGATFHSLVDDRLYVLTPASMISGLIEMGYGDFPSHLSSIKPEDNHVLTIYTLK